MTKQKKEHLSEVAEALFIVNRHAKTAPDPKQLYELKKKTINKLLKEKLAEKMGLHFSDHPKLSHQHSTLLVKVSNYYFHIPPSKEDFKTLEHLGNLDADYRNPKPKMSLSQAKRVLNSYLGIKEPEKKKQDSFRAKSSYFTPSSLGQMEWPPPRRGRKK